MFLLIWRVCVYMVLCTGVGHDFEPTDTTKMKLMNKEADFNNLMNIDRAIIRGSLKLFAADSSY